MTPALHQYIVAIVLYWLLMLPIAAYIFHAVAGYCTDDAPPTFRRAVLLVLATAAAVFFTYDFSGYLFARMMTDPNVGVNFPPDYSYTDWLREPLALKWQVLGLLPIIRFVPVVFDLTVGGVTQVVLWKVEFRLGVVVFVAQVVLTATAMVILSMVFRFAISYYEEFFPPTPSAEVQRPARHELTAAPADLGELAERCDQQKANRDSVWRRLGGKWDAVNGHLAPFYRVLQPITRHLPNPVQDFLNSGGWLLVLAGTGGLIAFRRRIHRTRKQVLAPRAQRRAKATPRVEMAFIGDSASVLGPRQATVRGVPSRLRLIVMTPDAAATGAAAVPAPVDQFLDSIYLELSALTAADYPRAEVWSDPAAGQQFRQTCASRLEFPKSDDQASPWVVLVGTTSWHGLPTPVALAFYSAQPHVERFVDVPSGQWADFIGVREVPKDEQM